ncbi:hypothetical protein psyc5s11_25260 [Clostridium gelidum]|uniref:DUF3795 domain-containing protein n=1 Tax=Clostridium gelidum TaxID=704125 RepID=A0ABN6IWM9_9CLOT|nr:DUF3795 domain-containing protein [Clostridium gelidum]BCZ46459.1 hypothetical protein psyc5s11_25260 [Clostridium gelidum]
MKKKGLLEKIAPCSLMCHTCIAYEDGVISQTAKQLSKYTEGICEFYEKHSPNEIERFKVFQEELAKYSAGKCSGCRNKEHLGCSIKGCFILDCTKERDIDYCGECAEFPCDKMQKIFEEEVYMQWLKGNREIKNWGIEVFWEKNCERPHYKAYKEN